MMNGMFRRGLFLILILSVFIATVLGQKTNILYAADDDGKVYTSIAEALQSEKPVYRLKITKLANRDSLPEELFQLTELRELTVKGRKLCRLNQNIDKLVHLQYLNLDHNLLLRLPETIGNLTDLRTLVVSRNILEELPESIGNLHQLATIDAWGNPLYALPHSINNISKTLKTLDLRQIPLSRKEYDAMEQLLPETDILFTDICECENRRDHN
jgi:hypothetical protein